MKNYLLASFLSLVAFQAAAQEKRDSALLIESSFVKLAGLPYPTDYDRALAVIPEGGGEPNIFMDTQQVTQLTHTTRVINVPRVPGMSQAQANSAGLAGGLIASAIIDAKIYADRQKTIQPIRDVINKKLLKDRVLGVVQETLSATGYPVKASFIADTISDKTLETALKGSDVSHAFVIRKSLAPMVSISADNQKPMLSAIISHYEKRGDGFKKTYEITMVFIGHAAVAKASSNLYWSENNGERFLAEVKTGFERMVRHAVETGPNLPSEKEQREKEKMSRKNPLLTIEIVKSDADFAYGFVESSYYLVAPVQKHAEAIAAGKAALFNALPDMAPSLRPETPVIQEAAMSLKAGTAKLSFVGLNDSEDEANMRRVTMAAFQSDDCNKKSELKLGEQNLSFKKADKAISETYVLNAGSRVHFNLNYIDVRFAQNRMCESSVSFIPAANHDYQVEFIVDRNVTRCDARVVEIGVNGAKSSAEFSAPPLVCGRQKPNGVAKWNNF